MPLSDVEEPLIDEEKPKSVKVHPVGVASASSRNHLSIAMKVLFMIATFLSVVYLLTTSTEQVGSTQFPKITTDDGSNKSEGSHPFNSSSHFRLPKDSSYKYILLYSDFYDDDRNWYLGTNLINDSYFANLQCPETKCIVTSNRTFLAGGVTDFDSLLFFAHNKWDLKLKDFPQARRNEQIYVVGMLETPYHTWRTFKNDHDWDYFNWTMTYRFESDVFWPYGYFVSKQTDAVISPAQNPAWLQLESDHFDRPFFHNETLLRLISNKKNMAAWFVSNCYYTESNRGDVADQMAKFLQVDIYGKCGNKSCPKGKQEECQQMLEKDYKFYLSFENSLCKDYITEKAFSNMNYYLIPVLYNSADNNKFLPPNSYLNVLDYESIEELTSHMQYLADHPDEYIKYFWWKEYYFIRSGYNFCDLCVKLHEDNVVQRRQYYHDLDAWYRDGACISAPKIPMMRESDHQ